MTIFELCLTINIILIILISRFKTGSVKTTKEYNVKKKLFFLTISSLFISQLSLFAGVDNYWQQFVHYNFNVHLDVEKHVLTGDGTITYKNNSPDTLDRIYLHLYPNAFKNEHSTLAREAKQRNYRRRITQENKGYIDILEFRINRKKQIPRLLKRP